jgi:hypothetical protein
MKPLATRYDRPISNCGYRYGLDEVGRLISNAMTSETVERHVYKQTAIVVGHVQVALTRCWQNCRHPGQRKQRLQVLELHELCTQWSNCL